MYAIGGSANPTINSQGNRYTAPVDANAKEVTKRVDTDEREWSGWNWRSEGDVMVNGAFFVPSGDGGLSNQYAKASSVEPKSADIIDQLTLNAGVFGAPRDNSISIQYGGGTTTGASGSGAGGSTGAGDESDFFGMMFGNNAPGKLSSTTYIILLSLLVILVLYITTNHGDQLSLQLLLLLL